MVKQCLKLCGLKWWWLCRELTSYIPLRFAHSVMVVYTPFRCSLSPSLPRNNAVLGLSKKSVSRTSNHCFRMREHSPSKKTNVLVLFFLSFNRMELLLQSMSARSMEMSSFLRIPVFTRSVAMALSRGFTMKLRNSAISSGGMTFRRLAAPSCFFYCIKYRFLIAGTRLYLICLLNWRYSYIELRADR